MAAVHHSPSCHWATVAVAAPLHRLVTWYRVSQERVELRDLPADRLADIGLSQRDVESEIRRPFWQADRDA